MAHKLKSRYKKAIVDILASNPRVKRAVLFGSRAMNTGNTTSDVDIALFGTELDLDDLSQLTRQIQSLPMPQKIDLVRYHHIDDENVRKHIQQHGIEWYRQREQDETR